MKERYDGLDGLRTYSIIGIALMHVFSNGNYSINSVASKVISPLGNLVYLFILISAFGMCCGYYERFKTNSISIDDFYKKRYMKIWPYFALLCFIDVMVSPSLGAICESFANLTLTFSLLPNSRMSVIGVGWTLGVIFLFYILFPFFVYLIWDRRRAWFTFLITFVYNLLCRFYFDIDSSNILYMAMYFVAGGLIYLYRKELKKFVQNHRSIAGGILIISIVCFYLWTYGIWSRLVMSSVVLINALDVKARGFLQNKLTHFISGISFEIYLSHMIIYRVIERLNLNRVSDNDTVSYAVTCIATIVGSVVFSVVVQAGEQKVKGIILKKSN